MSTLYVTDLDGTFLDENAHVSKESVRILKPMLERGLLFTVATARSPATVVNLLQALPMRLPVVLLTGALLFDLQKKRSVRAAPLRPHAAQMLCRLLDETGGEALAYCVRDGQLCVYYRRLTCAFERAFVQKRMDSPYKTFVQAANYKQALINAQPLLFLFAIDSETKARIWYDRVSKIPDTVCYLYAEEYTEKGYILEVYSQTCSKATAVQEVMQQCGANRLVSFGDNVNDLPLFAQSDISCAVANAALAVRSAATMVIGANTETSVAKWLACHAEY